jgi:hypothetical protein
MSPLTSAELLDAWERALPLPATGRPLALLAAAGGGGDPAALAALPVGARDGRLLDLLEVTFGPRLQAVATCPACGEDLELACTVDQIRASAASRPEKITINGYELSVRPPDSRDLTAAARLGDPELARLELLHRCVIVLSGPVGPAVDPLPEPVVAAVEDAMLAADPQAEVLVAVTCEACGQLWRATLDIAAFLWTLVDAHARRCAAEVHTLALAYGWREADILAMSPWRRGLYLQMVSS